MANKAELLRLFKSNGVRVSHEDVLNCCVDMCGRLFMDERELVDSWLVYSRSIGGAEPTVPLLLQMEGQEFDEKTLASDDKSLDKSDEKTKVHRSLESALLDLDSNRPD